MNDILTQAWLAFSGVRPLDPWGAVRLADHLLAPLDLLLRALARALDVPVIGAALVPAFVTFEFVTTLIAVVLVAGLLIGSALLYAFGADLGALLGPALARVLALAHALGGR